MTKPISLIEHILLEEKKFPKAKGNFTLLLSQIEYAGRIIASHIKKAGLVDILSHTGLKNATEDEVIKLDEYSNQILIDTLSISGLVHAVASEEMDDVNILEKDSGDYLVFFDPLDGSKNTEINVTVGTIFSVYHKNNSLLQPGRKQIASGYILYGTSVMFVYTCGNGVHGFTLDPSIGSFILSHPDIRIPEYSKTYSINEGNSKHFNEYTKQYIKNVKASGEYKARYIGSMVADVHRTLLKGGLFLYPSDEKNPNGKLRLLFEVNPLSYLVEQAGGMASTGSNNPLDILPGSLHQKSPCIIGGLKNVEEYLAQ